MTDETINIIDVTIDNVDQVGIFCIKNKKSPGFKKKVNWFKNKLNKGLKMKIATNEANKQLGFIEYIPSEQAWRPIKADNYIFIQCIAVFVKDAKRKHIGSTLLQICEAEAKQNNKHGICVMSSGGAWMANRTIFAKNNFSTIAILDRFELMAKKFHPDNPDPKLIDWTKKQSDYDGWNLIYSDQCPWHEKSISDLKLAAIENGVNLKLRKLNTPREAQNAPSGFGTFSLIKDGKLLEDHYLSKTRFENILKKELKQK